MPSITVTPLTTTIGARIDGVDLRRTISEEDAERIRQALWSHCVIVFKSPDIGLEQQKALASVFGPLEAVLAHRLVGDHDPVTIIDNEVWRKSAGDRLPDASFFKDEFQGWHVDSAFGAEIPRIACLRAELLPPVGGGTCWANMAAGYDALSPIMRDWLETLDVIYAPPPGYRRFLDIETQPEDVREQWEQECAPRRHPLVARHPDSGRKQLYVNPAYAVKVDKLSGGESAMLLRYLFQHCYRPDFVYRHLWNDGDVVIWDELATTHLAPTDYLPHERRLVRVFAGSRRIAAARDFGSLALAAERAGPAVRPVLDRG